MFSEQEVAEQNARVRAWGWGPLDVSRMCVAPDCREGFPHCHLADGPRPDETGIRHLRHVREDG
jgi:hypothetical protein